VSAEDRRSGMHDRGDDAAAYVLGALEPAEAEEFRRHMDECMACRGAVCALQQVADSLPMAAPRSQAPSALRRRVLDTVRSEPRSPEAVPQRRRRPRAWGSPLARPALALAALLAAAAILAVGLVLGSRGPGGTRVVAASVGSAQLRVSGGRGELLVRQLPPPPPGKIYEVWVERGKQAPTPTSALFGVTTRGTAVVGVPGNLRGISAVLVTPEPLGGSLAPTHTPVIVAPVP
jgi:anti-sigma-K factor RskA